MNENTDGLTKKGTKIIYKPKTIPLLKNKKLEIRNVAKIRNLKTFYHQKNRCNRIKIEG